MVSLQHVRHTRSDSLIGRMGIKWMENFESKVDIPEDRKSELEALLTNQSFCKQVHACTSQKVFAYDLHRILNFC